MEKKFTNLLIVELAAWRATEELMNDKKINETLASEFVYLFLEHLHKIEHKDHSL